MTAHQVEWFEALYRRDEDPWRFASSPYELDRYRSILQGLGRERYPSAFEIGCSIGVFTALLAPRCDRVLAVDVAPSAIAQARLRCGRWPQVELRVADVRTMAVEGLWDLILLNEVGYYFDSETLAALAHRLSGRLGSGGEFVASHWLGRSDDHVLHGDAVHDVLRRTLTLRLVRSTRHEQFRVDAWAQDSAER